MTYISDKHILWAFVAALATGWVLSYDEGCYYGTVMKHSCNWTCMLLTLQWPGSFCIGLTNKTTCKIPLTIQNWTIHGLWPTHTGRCCNCWPIFHSQLQEIEPELTQLWPSLIKGKHFFNFWREEWIKHGTCAGCDEAMGSPLLYFQAAVKLRKLFDINSVLVSSGIKPSCEVSYKYDNISRALTSLLGDNYDLQCVTDSKGREAWIQLKIHLSRNQTIGCPTKELNEAFNNLAWYKSPGHPCPKNTTIFFVPINYDNPHEPCD